MPHLHISVPLKVPSRAQPSPGNLGVEQLQEYPHYAIKIRLTLAFLIRDKKPLEEVVICTWRGAHLR